MTLSILSPCNIAKGKGRYIVIYFLTKKRKQNKTKVYLQEYPTNLSLEFQGKGYSRPLFEMAVKYWCACCCDILGTPHLGRVTHQMSEGLGHILHRHGSGVHLRVLWKGLVKIRLATHQGGWLGSIMCGYIHSYFR